MTLKLITAPADEPISLATARLHLRIDDDNTEDDNLIIAIISAARQQAEHETGRALVSQTWEQVLDYFPAVELELPKPPVSSITSIVYIDTAGVSQTLAGAAYTLDADGSPPSGWAIPAYGTSWPATLDTADAVRVRFVCGYGGAADVPAAIRQWMLMQIGALYRSREAFQTGISVAELPNRFVGALLDPFRTYF
jgi:uncharacterized phiE125 gp8 family phage protein